MILLIIFALIVAIGGFVGFRQMIRAKTTSGKVAGGVLVAILLGISLFLISLMDALSAANDRARLLACSRNMKLVFQATLQYKQSFDSFPSNLAAISSGDIVPECFHERNGPGVLYCYEQPERDADPNQRFCWCAKPHHIRHRWLRFRNCRSTNTLYPNGVIKQETAD